MYSDSEMLALVHRRIAGASIPVSILRIDKTFRLHHIQLFLKETVKERCFDAHLPDFINAANAKMIPTDLSIATDEKISS